MMELPSARPRFRARRPKRQAGGLCYPKFTGSMSTASVTSSGSASLIVCETFPTFLKTCGQDCFKMSDEILRYTDLAALIQMAKARGWPTERIVREMSGGLPYSEAMNLGDRRCYDS